MKGPKPSASIFCAILPSSLYSGDVTNSLLIWVALRPLAVVVLRDGAAATEAELLGMLAGRFAKFWVPDWVVFVGEIPRTSTGKMLKAKLREDYRNWGGAEGPGSR